MSIDCPNAFLAGFCVGSALIQRILFVSFGLVLLTAFVSAPLVWHSDGLFEIQEFVGASPTTTSQFDPKILFAATVLGILPGFA
jgi:hypothetical protein